MIQRILLICLSCAFLAACTAPFNSKQDSDEIEFDISSTISDEASLSDESDEDGEQENSITWIK